jgi:hypothetical protein
MESWLLRKKNVLVLLGLSGVVGLIEAASNAGACADTKPAHAAVAKAPKAQGLRPKALIIAAVPAQ